MKLFIILILIISLLKCIISGITDFFCFENLNITVTKIEFYKPELKNPKVILTTDTISSGIEPKIRIRDIRTGWKGPIECGNVTKYQVLCELNGITLTEGVYIFDYDFEVFSTDSDCTNYTLDLEEKNVVSPLYNTKNNIQSFLVNTEPILLNSSYTNFIVYFTGYYIADTIYFDDHWGDFAICFLMYETPYKKMNCSLNAKNNIPRGNFSLYYGRGFDLVKLNVTGTYNSDPTIPLIILDEIIFPDACFPLQQNYNFKIKYIKENSSDPILNNLTLTDENITNLLNLKTDKSGETQVFNTINTTCKFNYDEDEIDCTTTSKGDTNFKYVVNTNILLNVTKNSNYILLWSSDLTGNSMNEIIDYYVISVDQYINKKNDKNFANDKFFFNVQFDSEYFINNDEKSIKLRDLYDNSYIISDIECQNSLDDLNMNLKFDCFVLKDSKLKASAYEILYNGNCGNDTSSGVYVYVSGQNYIKLNSIMIISMLIFLYIF